MPTFTCLCAELAGATRQVRPPAPLSQKDVTIPVVIMIGREITMSALREWAAASGSAAHRAVKVNTLGKYKTALQVRARTFSAARLRQKRCAGYPDSAMGSRPCNGLAWVGIA
jgi:phosphatidylglycerophosphate synthase